MLRHEGREVGGRQLLAHLHGRSWKVVGGQGDRGEIAELLAHRLAELLSEQALDVVEAVAELCEHVAQVAGAEAEPRL